MKINYEYKDMNDKQVIVTVDVKMIYNKQQGAEYEFITSSLNTHGDFVVCKADKIDTGMRMVSNLIQNHSASWKRRKQ